MSKSRGSLRKQIETDGARYFEPIVAKAPWFHKITIVGLSGLVSLLAAMISTFAVFDQDTLKSGYCSTDNICGNTVVVLDSISPRSNLQYEMITELAVQEIVNSVPSKSHLTLYQLTDRLEEPARLAGIFISPEDPEDLSAWTHNVPKAEEAFLEFQQEATSAIRSLTEPSELQYSQICSALENVAQKEFTNPVDVTYRIDIVSDLIVHTPEHTFYAESGVEEMKAYFDECVLDLTNVSVSLFVIRRDSPVDQDAIVEAWLEFFRYSGANISKVSYL